MTARRRAAGVLRFCQTCKVWWTAHKKNRRWCPMCHALCVDQPLEPSTPRDPRELRPGVIAEW